MLTVDRCAVPSREKKKIETKQKNILKIKGKFYQNVFFMPFPIILNQF